jgi:hypothetical protein
MSDHCSAANLKFPVTTLVRISPTCRYSGGRGKTVLITDVNPYTSGMGQCRRS